MSALLNFPDRTEEWFQAPPLAHGESFVKADAYRSRDDGPRLGPVGRVYAWGPSAGDWSGVGRWVARWRSPFSGSSVVVSSAVAPAPFHDLESARTEFVHPNAAAWTATVSEDGAHALFLTHPNGRPPELTAIDEHGSLAPITRVDGEPWSIVDSAVRIGSDWFIASPVDAQRDHIEILRADARGARRLTMLERQLYGLPPPETVRLARSESGSLVGVLVEGEPPADGLRARRWVIPVSIESGESLAPEPLGMPDLSDRYEVPVCTDGAGSGWVIEAPWPDANVTIDLGPAVAPVKLPSVLARFRVSSDRACVERLAADISEEGLAAVVTRQGVSRPVATEPTLPMVVATDEPIALRCSVAALGKR